MIINKSVKFTLSAVLLAAGAMAYADGPVKLKDNTTVAWSEFVKAINNPVTVKGTVDPTSSVATAYTNANTRLTNATSNLTAKENAKSVADQDLKDADKDLKTAQGKVSSAERRQTEAATGLTAAQKAYTAANEEYNTATGKVSTANTQLRTLEKNLATAQASVTDLENQLNEKYQGRIKTKNDSLKLIGDPENPASGSLLANAIKERDRYLRLRNALVTTTYEEVTPVWLTREYNRAVKFQTSYQKCEDIWNGESDYSSNRENYLFYKLENVGSGRNARWELTLSFEETHTIGDGWKQAYEDQYNDFMWQWSPDNNNANPDNNKPTRLYIDLGSNYPTNNGIVQITTYSQVPSTALGLAVEYLKNLVQTYKEKSETPTETISNQALYDEYDSSYEDYKSQAETLEGRYNQLNAEITQIKGEESSDPLNTQIETAKGEVTSIETQITPYETDITTYQPIVDKYQATTYKDEEGNEKSYIGADNKVVTYLNYLSYQQTLAQAEKTAADKAVTDAQKEETAAQSAVNSATNAVSNAELAVTAAETEKSNAQSAFDSAQIAYDAAQEAADAAATAAAQDKYNEITLSGNIDATEPITNAYSGTIYGEGAIINVNIKATETNTQTSLFNAFSGHVDDAGINGTFAKNLTGSSFADVARWDGTNGRIYNERGDATEYTSTDYVDPFGAFGFALRGNQYFGVDFNSGEIVNATVAPSNVFSLTSYELPAGNGETEPVATQTYVQLAAQGSTAMVTSDKATYAVPQNRFAQSANADVAGKNLANVYYGANNTCENVEIVDRENFYSPVTIQAQSINYDRKLVGGSNSVCLPFEISSDMSDDILSVCEYESVNTEAKKFWFKQPAEGARVAANTPVLIVVKEDATDAKLTINKTVSIAATDPKQIVTNDAMYGTSKSYGTLKKAGVSEFAGMQYASNIYGLNSKGNFQKVGNTATLPAFRMVIATETAITATAGAYDDLDEFTIGIRNEFGEDITDDVFSGNVSGVEEVAANETSVVGGQGVITITSGADLGQVGVYSIDGKMVAKANVTEGTTTVNVKGGIYIVLGQKVLVK